MPTLEFSIPNGRIPISDTTKKAETVSYSDTATVLTNANLPRYIQWTSGLMTCTASKSAGAGKLPLLMKIGDLTIYNNPDGIPFSGSTKNEAKICPKGTVDEKGNITEISGMSDVIKLSGEGNYSVAILYWILGADSSWPKYYSYENTGLTIEYNNPKFIINGLSNDTSWGEIIGTGVFEISSKNQELTQTITATPKPNCRFLCWTDGVTTPARTISLKESELTSANTILTYSALFAPTALYVGTKPVSAIYVGTKKAKVYRGTTRIL